MEEYNFKWLLMLIMIDPEINGKITTAEIKEHIRAFNSYDNVRGIPVN